MFYNRYKTTFTTFLALQSNLLEADNKMPQRSTNEKVNLQTYLVKVQAGV